MRSQVLDAPRGVILIQPGWQLSGKDGLPIGEVVAVNQRSIHVRTHDDARTIEIPADSVIEQEEQELWARVS